MFSLKSVFVTLMTVVMAAAWSAPTDPYVGAAVVALPEEVTLQRPGLTPLAAYKVTLTNNAANVLNRVSFVGTALLMGAASPVIAVDKLIAAPAWCSAAVNAVTCAGGSLAPRSSLVFYVVLKSPFVGDEIRFGWSFSGAEGNSQTGVSFYEVRGDALTTLTDALSTSGKKKAQSFVTPEGLTLFTGDGTTTTDPVGSPAKPLPDGDPYTTTVVIPSGDLTTATIDETEAQSFPCQVGACFTTQLTIPGTFTPKLIIYLRSDGSVTSGNIKNAVVYYTADTAGATPIQLADCDLTTPRGPSSNKPCINSRMVFTRSNSPSPVEDWVKDWQIEIWATENGKYAQ